MDHSERRELYQRRYPTSYIYWPQPGRSVWTSCAVEWVVKTFLEDEGKQIDYSATVLVKFACKGDNPSEDFCTSVGKKLKEMYISPRMVLGESGSDVSIVPAEGSAVYVIAHFQMMLKIKEELTFLFW